MNLINRLMLRLGYVNKELYHERDEEGVYYSKTLEQAIELLYDISQGELQPCSVEVVEFIRLHETGNL